MKRRNAITVFACLGLTLVLAGGLDARVRVPVKAHVTPAAPRAAAVKAPSPAASIAGAAAGATAGAAAATALSAAAHAASPAGAAPAAPPGAVPPGGATAAPSAAPAAAEPYTYNPAGKSDPFQPFVEVDLAVKKEKEKKAREEDLKRKTASTKRPISPLQQAEIKQFRLVGIAGDEKRRMAMVEDGAGKKYYPLFVGTYIGPNGGKVISIQPDRVIIEEPLLEEEEKGKKAQTQQITVMLHKEEEGKP